MRARTGERHAMIQYRLCGIGKPCRQKALVISDQLNRWIRVQSGPAQALGNGLERITFRDTAAYDVSSRRFIRATAIKQ